MRVLAQLGMMAGLAKVVPEGTENPCVDGSIPPPGTTESIIYSHPIFLKSSTLPVTLPVNRKDVASMSLTIEFFRLHGESPPVQTRAPGCATFLSDDHVPTDAAS